MLAYHQIPTFWNRPYSHNVVSNINFVLCPPHCYVRTWLWNLLCISTVSVMCIGHATKFKAHVCNRQVSKLHGVLLICKAKFCIVTSEQSHSMRKITFFGKGLTSAKVRCNMWLFIFKNPFFPFGSQFHPFWTTFLPEFILPMSSPQIPVMFDWCSQLLTPFWGFYFIFL